MVQKLSRLPFCLTLALSFILGNESRGDAPHKASGDKVKIGVILPLTGAFARYGQKVQAAISEFTNDSLTFIYDDEACSAPKAITAYKKLSQIDGVKIFLGPWCGSPQSAVAPLLKDGEQIALLGSSAPEDVFSISNGRMFSTQHSIEAESTYVAERLNEFHVESVVIIFKENSFSRAHESAFRTHFKGKVLETFAYTSDDISELKNIALKVKRLNPQALFVPDAFPLMAGLVNELHTYGLGDKRIYSVYSAQSDDVLKVVGTRGEGIMYSYPDIGEREAFNHFPKLAAEILTDAVKVCGNDISCIKKEMTKRQSFDEQGVLAGKLTLRTIRDGKFVPWVPQ